MEAQGPPLLRLVFEGDVRAVEAYLGAKTEADATEELNERGADGYTPLMHAVMMGDKDMAEMMLRHGADAMVKTEDRVYKSQGTYRLCLVGGRSLLHIAHSHARTSLLPWLESLGLASEPDRNGSLPEELSPTTLDDWRPVYDRIVQDGARKLQHALGPQNAMPQDEELEGMVTIVPNRTLLSQLLTDTLAAAQTLSEGAAPTPQHHPL